jgi:hypothetical protein
MSPQTVPRQGGGGSEGAAEFSGRATALGLRKRLRSSLGDDEDSERHEDESREAVAEEEEAPAEVKAADTSSLRPHTLLA